MLFCFLQILERVKKKKRKEKSLAGCQPFEILPFPDKRKEVTQGGFFLVTNQDLNISAALKQPVLHSLLSEGKALIGRFGETHPSFCSASTDKPKVTLLSSFTTSTPPCP